MGRAFPMTGVIVRRMWLVPLRSYDDSRRIPLTLVVGVRQKFYEPGEYKSRWTCGDEARQEIWDLSSDLRLTYEELMVFRSTMDDSKILGEDIPEFIKCLRVVGEEHGGNYIEQANKLQEFIDKEDISKISAISYNQTSVCCASDIFGEYYDAPLKKFWDCMISRDAYINFKKENDIG